MHNAGGLPGFGQPASFSWLSVWRDCLPGIMGGWQVVLVGVVAAQWMRREILVIKACPGVKLLFFVGRFCPCLVNHSSHFGDSPDILL